MFNLPGLPTLVAVGIALALLAGSYFTGRDHERTRWEARVNKERAEAEASARVRIEAAQAVADRLAVQLAAAEKKRLTVYKEIVRELPAATVGRPCLSGDALGLLDNFAGAAAGVPATAGRPADQGGAVATDTQIAGWAASVIEQHERERARCNALIEWHTHD